MCVASVSCIEVALLVKHRRLEIPCSLPDWFDRALHRSDIELLPLTPEIASTAAFLPDIHKDPLDRIIIATALAHNATLFSKDEKIMAYPDVSVYWG